MPRPSVLVIEDEPLIALDVVLTLEEAGYAVVGPAPTVPAALSALRDRKPDAVILDLNLQGELSIPVAEALQAARVPFLVVTAYNPAAIPPKLRPAAVLVKPVAARTLLSVIEKLLGGDAWGVARPLSQ